MSPDTKKNIRRLDLIRGALVLTLILYIAVALIMNSSYLTLDRLMRLRSDVVFALGDEGDPVTRLEADDTVDVVLFQDGFAVLTRNGISVRSSDGNEYSSHILQYKQPCVRASGKYLLCFDRGGTGWCLLNSFRVLCSGEEPGDIINGSVSDDGYFAIASEREESKGSVTVYNTDGLDLVRWNSEFYLIDAFFLGKSRLSVVAVEPNREKTNTVFTVFNYKNGQVLTAVSVADTFPLALGLKEGDSVEMLTASGAYLFDGESARAVYAYPEPSPGIFRQGKDATLISYQTSSGEILVEAFSSQGRLFAVRYPSVLSVDCYGSRFFILTASHLYILNASGEVVEQRPVTASEILASPEISVILTSSSVETLDLSSLP